MTQFKEEDGWKAIDNSDGELITKIKIQFDGDLISVAQEVKGMENTVNTKVMLLFEELEEIYSLAKRFKELSEAQKETDSIGTEKSNVF